MQRDWADSKHVRDKSEIRDLVYAIEQAETVWTPAPVTIEKVLLPLFQVCKDRLNSYFLDAWAAFVKTDDATLQTDYFELYNEAVFYWFALWSETEPERALEYFNTRKIRGQTYLTRRLRDLQFKLSREKNRDWKVLIKQVATFDTVTEQFLQVVRNVASMNYRTWDPLIAEIEAYRDDKISWEGNTAKVELSQPILDALKKLKKLGPDPQKDFDALLAETEKALYEMYLRYDKELAEKFRRSSPVVIIAVKPIEGLLDGDAPPDVTEMLLLRMVPASLVATSQTSAYAREFTQYTEFRTRYMRRWTEEIREIMTAHMRTSRGGGGTMLDWMAQALEENVWLPSSPIFEGAIARGLVDPVRIILESGKIDPGYGHSHPLNEAVESNSAEMVRLLLADPRIRPEDPQSRAISVACTDNKPVALRVLLEDGRANPDVQKPGKANRYLLLAVERNFPAILALLLKDGRAKPELGVNAVLFNAVSSFFGVACVVELLKDKRVRVDEGIVEEAINAPSVAILDALLKSDRLDTDAVTAYKYMRLRWIDTRTGTYYQDFNEEIEDRLLEEPTVRHYLHTEQ